MVSVRPELTPEQLLQLLPLSVSPPTQRDEFLDKLAAILADLQEQHDAAVEQGREKLKQTLGESEFAKFDGFLRRFMGPDVKVEKKVDRVPPTSQKEKPKK